MHQKATAGSGYTVNQSRTDPSLAVAALCLMQDKPVWQQLDERLDNSKVLAPDRLRTQRDENTDLKRMVASLQEKNVQLQEQIQVLQQQVAQLSG